MIAVSINEKNTYYLWYKLYWYYLKVLIEYMFTSINQWKEQLLWCRYLGLSFLADYLKVLIDSLFSNTGCLLTCNNRIEEEVEEEGFQIKKSKEWTLIIDDDMLTWWFWFFVTETSVNESAVLSNSVESVNIKMMILPITDSWCI